MPEEAIKYDGSYQSFKDMIADAPITWLPGLLSHMIETAQTKNVFVEGGLEKFTADVLRRWNEKQNLDIKIHNSGQTRKESE